MLHTLTSLDDNAIIPSNMRSMLRAGLVVGARPGEALDSRDGGRGKSRRSEAGARKREVVDCFRNNQGHMIAPRGVRPSAGARPAFGQD
jgi:hypothetical protein